MALRNQLINQASSILTSLGDLADDATFTKVTKGAYDASTGGYGDDTTTTTTVKAIQLAEGSRELGDSPGTTTRIVVAAKDAGSIDVNDTVSLGGESWSILSIDANPYTLNIRLRR